MENIAEHAWKKLLKASNDLCNYYAPSKVVQRKANFQPYITDEIQDIEKNIKIAYNNAAATGIESDWKTFNREKSIYQKTLAAAKDNYIARGLMNPKGVWSFISTITGGSNI